MKVFKPIGKDFADIRLPDPESGKTDVPPVQEAPPVEPPPIPKKLKKNNPPPPQDNEPKSSEPEGILGLSHRPFKGPRDYFLTIGSIFYDRNCILMDRQVLRFCNPCSMWHHQDKRDARGVLDGTGVRYVRLTVLMRTINAQDPGTPVLDDPDIPLVDEGFAELDSRSYRSSLKADSIAGFTGTGGNVYAESKGKEMAPDICKLVKGRVSKESFAIKGEPELSSRSLWPSFFLKTNSPVYPAIEMFDLEIGKWCWFTELQGLSPITVGIPGAVSISDVLALERKLWKGFSLRGSVYVGMRNMRSEEIPAYWQGPQGIKREEWQEHKIPAADLDVVMMRHKLLFHGWSYPAPKDKRDTNEHEARVLNALVQSKINRMLGSTA